LESAKGILITSPGSGLLSQIEKELNVDFTRMNLAELCETLPRVISENLNLARETELLQYEAEIQLKLSDSLYQNLYSEEKSSKSITLLGCPVASAVACAIAKSSGKPVVIQRQKTTLDGLTIDVWYRIVQE
jgi:adenine/guanine phosphoribosyltransferase-like PRPP-binding protein